MPVSQVSVRLTAVALLIFTSVDAHAGPQAGGVIGGDERSRAQKWFDRAWSEAQVFPAFERASLAWRTEDHETLPREELAALKREVAAHPEHPARDMVPQMERHAAGHPTVIRFELFSLGSDSWRYNTTFESGEFNDAVRTPRSTWWMSRESLKILDPSEVDGSDPEQAMGSLERQFMSPLGKLLHGYMSIGRTAGLRPGPLAVDGDRWKVRTLVEPGTPAEQRLVVEFQGRWDSASARGVVERVTTVENGYRPQFVGRYHEFKDWSFVESLGRWVARSAEEHGPDGTLVRATTFEGSDALPAGGFAAVTAVPDIGKPDVLRGGVSFKYVGDYNRREIRALDQDGVVVTTKMESGPGNRARSLRDALRWAGWAMIGGVGALGFFVLRRRPQLVDMH